MLGKSDGGSAFGSVLPRSPVRKLGGPPHRASDFFRFDCRILGRKLDDSTSSDIATLRLPPLQLTRTRERQQTTAHPIPITVPLLPEIAGTRSPGTRIPTRFSGSAADSVIVSPLSGRPAHRSHRFHRDRQRELLAQESIDEPPAANLAAIFEPAEGHQQFAPRRQVRFARQHIANHNSVAPQQHPARGLDRARALRPPHRHAAAPSAPHCAADACCARFPARRAAWDRSATADCRTRRRSPARQRPVPKVQSRFPPSACPCRAQCRQRTTRRAAAETRAPAAPHD